MTPQRKPFWQSRTLWINIISLLIALAAELNKAQYGIPDTVAPILAIAGPILNLILRALSGQPLSFRRDE